MNIRYVQRIALFFFAALCATSANSATVAIVSAKSPNTPSREQVCQIFLGKLKSPAPITMTAGHPTRNAFYSKACGKDVAQVRSIWAKLTFTGGGSPPKEVSGDAEMKQTIAANPNLIGYIDKKSLDSSVRAIATFD